MYFMDQLYSNYIFVIGKNLSFLCVYWFLLYSLIKTTTLAFEINLLTQGHRQQRMRANKAMEKQQNSLPLHVSHVKKSSLIINRSFALLHFTSLAFLVYYRVSYFFQESNARAAPLLPWLLVFAAELLLSFQWLLGIAYRWRPISRTVFPERLPEADQLPGIDVFICTADPTKEPTVEVINTVLSAMALDYPPEKLHVYLSDDGGASITLLGMREAWKFARWWLPFCKRFGIKTICPEAYFSDPQNDDVDSGNAAFIVERQNIKVRLLT